jgi:hypothetical protein
LKLAVDIKGNPVWDLRVATADDAEAISKLTGGRYTTDVLAPLLSSKTCIVGESGNQLVTAALVTAYKGALQSWCRCVYVRKLLKACPILFPSGVRSKEQGVAGGLEDRAELLSVAEYPGLPETANTWRRQTALGALKMLKGKGYSDVVCAIPADDKPDAQFLKELGMQARPMPRGSIR